MNVVLYKENMADCNWLKLIWAYGTFKSIRLLNKRVVRAYYLLDDDYNSISYDLFLALAG